MSFKGRENVYVCQKCRGLTVTIDVDDGVTPFMIRCRAAGEDTCDGQAYSSFYPEGPRPAHIPAPGWEWYRPTLKQAKRFDRKWPGSLQHVENGGLWLRRRRAARPTGSEGGE